MAPTNSLLGFLRGGNSGGGIGSKTLLLNELRNPKPDIARIDAAVDELLDAKVPFKAAYLGGGPFNAVYTRGPVLGWTAFTGNATGSRVIKQTDNQVTHLFGTLAECSTAKHSESKPSLPVPVRQDGLLHALPCDLEVKREMVVLHACRRGRILTPARMAL
jgi:hypothetical protein